MFHGLAAKRLGAARLSEREYPLPFEAHSLHVRACVQQENDKCINASVEMWV